MTQSFSKNNMYSSRKYMEYLFLFARGILPVSNVRYSYIFCSVGNNPLSLKVGTEGILGNTPRNKVNTSKYQRTTNCSLFLCFTNLGPGQVVLHFLHQEATFKDVSGMQKSRLLNCNLLNSSRKDHVPVILQTDFILHLIFLFIDFPMASSPITSWQIDGEKVETVTDFIFLSSKITEDSDCCHEIKTLAPWKKNYEHTKRQGHHFTDKVLYGESYGFSSSHVWMWELDHKEGSVSKNGCFWTVVLGKILESSMGSKEMKWINSKGNQPWIYIGRTDAEVEAPIFGFLMGRADSLEKTLMLGKIEGRRRRE